MSLFERKRDERKPIIDRFINSGVYHLNQPFAYASKVRVNGTYPIFCFAIVSVGTYYEIDIVSLPSYNGRPTSGTLNHWLPSARGGKKICVSSGREPTSEYSAIRLAMIWADIQAEYIRSGIAPDQQ